MKLRETGIEGLVVLEPQVFGDARGFFLETYSAVKFKELGLPTDFPQDNLSRSGQGILRGLHFQMGDAAQGKMVRVTRGSVFDVAVDVRPGSQTFGKHFGIELSEDNKLSMYVPVGFAHGFCVLSDTADFQYMCTRTYQPKTEGGIIWNDPDLAINWPITTPKLSDKDAVLPRLRDIKDKLHFVE